MWLSAELKVNGRFYEVKVKPHWTLAYVLRRILKLTEVKIGCEVGLCGACTILLNGRAVPSCQILALQARNKEIITIKGLMEDPYVQILKEKLAEHGAFQCGFCMPGIILSVRELLAEDEDITERKIIDALSGHLCRCTGYIQQISAIRAAVEAIKELQRE